MTAMIDRDAITAAQNGASAASLLTRHGSAAVDHRSASRARGFSPRLSRARAGESITPSNEVEAGDVRTAPTAIRVTGARGSARRTVERPRVRSAAPRAPRGASRAEGCARRTPKPSWVACLLFGAGLFAGLLVLFSGSAQAEPAAAAPAGSAQPALTSVVTVRAGQSLEQIAREIAPDRAPAAVVAEIASINGLQGGVLHPGQTLITPRY